MPASWMQLFCQLLLLLASCRHIKTKTPGPTSPVAVPVNPLPTLAKSVVLNGERHTERVELLNPVNLALECTWTGNKNKLPNVTGLWRKDGHEIENSLAVQLENKQYQLKRVFSISGKENLGNYSCMFGSEARIDFILAAPQLKVRDKPIVSYVGDSAVIVCEMEESKPKPSTWNWYKLNGTDKEQILAAAAPHRYEIQNKERKTHLLVHNLTEADSGSYYCGAVFPIGTSMGQVELKVITFYQPLKPFIAIVVEVTILVAAILLYEKSQSEKNSRKGNGVNDQTNTLTLGEDNGSDGSSSMRQRKV